MMIEDSYLPALGGKYTSIRARFYSLEHPNQEAATDFAEALKLLSDF